jgi:hypothetical protein
MFNLYTRALNNLKVEWVWDKQYDFKQHLLGAIIINAIFIVSLDKLILIEKQGA